jgi:hypothetical protein
MFLVLLHSKIPLIQNRIYTKKETFSHVKHTHWNYTIAYQNNDSHHHKKSIWILNCSIWIYQIPGKISKKNRSFHSQEHKPQWIEPKTNAIHKNFVFITVPHNITHENRISSIKSLLFCSLTKLLPLVCHDAH